MGQSNAVTVRLASDLAVAATPDEKTQLAYRVFPRSQVFAPVKTGDTLGTCQIFLNGGEITQVNFDLIKCLLNDFFRNCCIFVADYNNGGIIGCA